MKTVVPLLALALLGLPAPAPAVPIVPTGKWVVDFDDTQCVASLAFGKEQLFLKAAAIGEVVQFGFMQPGRSGPPVQVAAEIVPAAGQPFGGNAVMWMAKGPPPQRLYLINMPVADFQRLSATPSLLLKLGMLRREIAIPAMPELARVMRTCVDDLQKVWSPGEGGVAVQAKASLASFFTDDDYPTDAIRKNFSGTTGLAMLIDEQGRVADCMVTRTSGQAGLDMQSCAVLKLRARFTPARDASGKPVRDRVTSQISWRIP
jgi:hypothetical protein